MDPLSQSTLEELLNPPSHPCLSLYLPTFKKSPDSLQNPIRFKNIVKQARDQLEKSSLSNHQTKEALSQAAARIQDEAFWQHQSLGLAVFISPQTSLFLRLPLHFPETVTVNNHFYFKPLLPLLTTNGKFFVLTLSQNDVKLYEATRESIDKRYLGDTPRSLKEHLGDQDFQRHLRFHTESSGQSSGGKPNVFHGQGAGNEAIKKLVIDFVAEVEKGVSTILTGEQAPLILAGVEYLTSMYRHANHYKNLLPDSVEGNFDHLGKTGIHLEAWKIARSHFKLKEKQAIDNFNSQGGHGKTTTVVSDVLSAAFNGQVQDLFITRDLTQWGRFDPKTTKVTLYDNPHPDSDDLFDLATIRTAGGSAYSLKPPEMARHFPEALIAATLRY
jgi:hypothetical protein